MLKTTRLVQNSWILISEDVEVSSISGDGDCEDKTLKKLLLISKNLNGTTGYLTLDAKQAFTQLR